MSAIFKRLWIEKSRVDRETRLLDRTDKTSTAVPLFILFIFSILLYAHVFTEHINTLIAHGALEKQRAISRYSESRHPACLRGALFLQCVRIINPYIIFIRNAFQPVCHLYDLIFFYFSSFCSVDMILNWVTAERVGCIFEINIVSRAVKSE